MNLIIFKVFVSIMFIAHIYIYIYKLICTCNCLSTVTSGLYGNEPLTRGKRQVSPLGDSLEDDEYEYQALLENI
jgi:hypothetical protein